jgi:choline dehydrogenase-like flavoprotein
MFFNRGSAPEYNAWEELGNADWGWESMLRYFKKSVEFGEPSKEDAERWGWTWDNEAAYGEKGPVKASFPPWNWPLVGTYHCFALCLTVPAKNEER